MAGLGSQCGYKGSICQGFESPLLDLNSWMWRSWSSRLPWTQEVAGSSPAIQTNNWVHTKQMYGSVIRVVGEWLVRLLWEHENVDSSSAYPTKLDPSVMVSTRDFDSRSTSSNLMGPTNEF